MLLQVHKRHPLSPMLRALGSISATLPPARLVQLYPAHPAPSLLNSGPIYTAPLSGERVAKGSRNPIYTAPLSGEFAGKKSPDPTRGIERRRAQAGGGSGRRGSNVTAHATRSLLPRAARQQRRRAASTFGAYGCGYDSAAAPQSPAGSVNWI